MADWKQNPVVLVVGILLIIIAIVVTGINLIPKSANEPLPLVRCPDCRVQVPLGRPGTGSYTYYCSECDGELLITEKGGECSECGAMVTGEFSEALSEEEY
ncbi:MAG: hypothetical protein ABH952_02390 [Candidatus Omnitrophota bacterium]